MSSAHFTTHGILFCAGLSLLVAHEMDAVRSKEWNMIGLLSSLGDEAGHTVFTLSHIPLLSAVFAALLLGSPALRGRLMLVINVFFILHFILHLAFTRHAGNRFRSAFSWSLICGLLVSGIAGLVA